MTRVECLQSAADCVSRDRQNDYGEPGDNFATVAMLWAAYKGMTFTSADVAAMLALLKIARLRTSPHKVANWVDLAGYAACGCEISTDDAQVQIGKETSSDSPTHNLGVPHGV